MVNLFIVTIVSLFYYTFDVLEDDIDSRKEATIKRLRRLAGETHELENDYKEKELWHLYNWCKLALYGLIVSYLAYGITLEGLMLICIIATMRIVYFNPFLSIRLGTGFFHLGQGKWESLFKGKEVLYYILNLIISLVCYSLIILKIH